MKQQTANMKERKIKPTHESLVHINSPKNKEAVKQYRSKNQEIWKNLQ